MKSKKEACMDEEAPLGAKKPRSLPTTDALLGNTSVVPLMRARSYTYTLSLSLTLLRQPYTLIPKNG